MTTDHDDGQTITVHHQAVRGFAALCLIAGGVLGGLSVLLLTWLLGGIG